MSNKVAVVTGANKGIGYSIVKKLLQRGVGVVYLTARDVSRGMAAVDSLKKEGLYPAFHQLDVSDRNSVKTFADHLKSKYGGLDILINNAAVIVNDFYETKYDDAKRVIDVNYRSMSNVEEYLFPLLKENGRVINVSSDCGHISNIKNKEWIKTLINNDVTREDIDAFVDWYLQSVKNGTLKEEDFTQMGILSYRISKVALCALTRVEQREVGNGISVNSLHPGFVKTDMTKGVGILTPDEAGDTPAYLALDIDQDVKGKYFWFDKTEKEWADPSLPLFGNFPLLDKYLREAGVV